MIDTDLIICQNELGEVLNMFGADAENIAVRHRFTEKDGKFVNTVTLNGHVYAYGNLVPDFKDEIERKRYVKRYAKLSLYKALSRLLGRGLPWGALTGIRPTKLAYSQLDECGEFKEFFTETMRVSEEKTKLTEEVLASQSGIYEKNDENTDFFVFIPLCPSRCKYCSFISSDINASKKYVDKYVECLIKEIEESAKHIKRLRSIYIGGGTPVCLPDDKLEAVLSAIDKINTGVEFTVEAGRPDAITPSNLAILKAHKVTRICLNPQTFQDKTLLELGRSHTASDIYDKYELVSKDFSVNMDLIAGLQGESLEDFKDTLQKTLELAPDNITIHTLCLKRGSTLAEKTVFLSDGETQKMVDYSYQTLKEHGYSPYYLYRQKYMSGNLENVGYTKPGKACIYNVDVMEEIAQNVACGANAISKRVYNGGQIIKRVAAPKDIPTYINKLSVIIEQKDELFK